MYSVIYTGQFKKSLKKCVKRGLDLKVFTDTLDLFQETGMLPTLSHAMPCCICNGTSTQ